MLQIKRQMNFKEETIKKLRGNLKCMRKKK